MTEWLIKTYSNENDVILDNCIGAGTTAIAAIRAKRNYIGIENDENYYNISINRIEEENKKKIE
jgi:DNA modification methylase